ncbi:type II toxin-antitoxin system YoeB family toxin [Desulfonema limicola]|uniref:type II toxin-antitoxin system YoeB family toxin n=1 Tax=Desulfonema limicola TaxID=45656 RepID=UPI001A9B7F55
MKRKIIFEGQAFQDFTEWAAEDRKLYQRIADLIMDICRQPFIRYTEHRHKRSAKLKVWHAKKIKNTAKLSVWHSFKKFNLWRLQVYTVVAEKV